MAKPHTVWQLSINHLILKPFGLDSRKAFMAASESAVQQIVANNPALKGHEFITPVEGRPKVFVMSGVLLSPIDEEGGADGHGVSFQISPDFSGSPFYPDGSAVSYKGTKNLMVGGGFVETFAVGNEAPSQQSGGLTHMPSPKLPLTLGDAIGISSAGYAEEISKIPAAKIFPVQEMNPHLEYWPVTRPGKSQDAVKFELGDGGNMENSGLLAMLQRGARKIVWFSNSEKPLVDQAELDFCKDTTSSFSGKIDGQVLDKFVPGKDLKQHNVVFAAENLQLYLCDLQKLMSDGKPTVLRRTFKVLPNKWWGITGGYDVDVLLVYNSKCQDFVKILPKETQDELSKGSDGDFAHFPNYKTKGQNSELDLVGLTAQQVNLLAAQGEYAVLQNRDKFEAMLR
jgi:hypothetical protein